MYIDFLREKFDEARDSDALVWRGEAYSYAFLQDALAESIAALEDADVRPGTVVGLEADFSPRSIAMLLALVDKGCVIVPLSSSVEAKKPEFRETAQIETTISIDEQDRLEFSDTGTVADQPILLRLKEEARPGLVLFSSGSTGKSKAAVHDFVPMLEKVQGAAAFAANHHIPVVRSYRRRQHVAV